LSESVLGLILGAIIGGSDTLILMGRIVFEPLVHAARNLLKNRRARAQCAGHVPAATGQLLDSRTPRYGTPLSFSASPFRARMTTLTRKSVDLLDWLRDHRVPMFQLAHSKLVQCGCGLNTILSAISPERLLISVSAWQNRPGPTTRRALNYTSSIN
jgi:hypothetical protein